MPVTKKFIVVEKIIEVPDEIPDYEGEIYECFNISPWGYYSDDTSYCVVHGKPGDVIELSLTYAHTGFQSYVETWLDMQGNVEKVIQKQECVFMTIDPSMWWIEDWGDGEYGFEAPAYGLGSVLRYNFIPWDREEIVWGNTFYGLTATAHSSYLEPEWHSGYLVDWGKYIYTPQLDIVSLGENIADAPKTIKKLTYKFTVSGTGSFSEIMQWENDHYEPGPNPDNYRLGVQVSAGASLIRPYDYSNKKKDTVLWIYDATATYNGVPVENANTNPFAYAGRLNIQPSGTANDSLYSVGTNQYGVKLISNKFKYEPWVRYPEL